MSGLKINPNLVMMQHKSNMVSQMLGGGSGVSSLSGIMSGTARMQARAITRQYDTFERLSDLGYNYSGGRDSGGESADDVDLSSASGTVREQAKKIMENYDKDAAEADKAAEGAENAPTEGKKADDAPKAEGGEPTQKSKTATYNTDKIDREIKRLREQKQQFEKQLRSASDPQQAVMLQKQISRLEKELQQKDNDAYRREHAEKSE